MPESADLFARNAADMAYSREVLGVHFPSDSVAGRGLARQIVDRMLEVPKFREDLEEARREIRGVRARLPANETERAAEVAGAKGREAGAPGADRPCC
jgi:hypothetical protein